MRTDRRSSIDLNADLGEEVTDDAALLAVVTSANVACGYHAGNARRSCARSAPRRRDAGCRVGAQVSYDDRENFGRVARDVPHDAAARAGGRPGRDAAARSPRRRAPRCATSSRTVRSTTGCSTTRSRRGRCWPGPGRLPVLGHARGAAARAGRGGRAGDVPRGLPGPRRTPRTAGCCRGPARARCSTDADEIAARAVELAADGRLGLRARRQPRSGRPARPPYAAALEAAGYVLRGLRR